ncbi:MAG: hypothetical protein WCS94_23140 [Verrucomicrobiota bacterium]
MKQVSGLIRRPWIVFYLKNKSTGQQTCLKTSDQLKAQRILYPERFAMENLQTAALQPSTGLTLSDKAGLTKLLHDLYDQATPRYR